MMFLQLAVGGHLLLFVVRTRHSVFKPPYPSAPLFLAIVATQIVAALICGFGILVPRLPWAAIAGVWVYCLLCMVVIDGAKLLYYRATEKAEAHVRGLAAPIARLTMPFPAPVSLEVTMDFRKRFRVEPGQQGEAQGHRSRLSRRACLAGRGAGGHRRATRTSSPRCSASSTATTARPC